MTLPSPLLTLREACAFLRCSRTTLYRLMRRRDNPLRVVRLGRAVRFRLSELERFTKRIEDAG